MSGLANHKRRVQRQAISAMTFADFLPKLEHELARLTPAHRLVFSAACCERAIRNFEIYARTTVSRDGAAVRQVLDEIWDHIVGIRATLDVEVLRQVCVEQVPPAHDQHPLASAAADAVQMVDLLLEQVMDPRPGLSREIAQWAEATIDGHLQTAEGTNTNLELIPMATLMQRELSRQGEDLDWLKNECSFDKPAILGRRKRYSDGPGNLGF